LEIIVGTIFCKYVAPTALRHGNAGLNDLIPSEYKFDSCPPSLFPQGEDMPEPDF
jgi:hypothetical protein